MRRGEVLALRWRDVDLDAGTMSIRRSAGMVRVAGGSRPEVTEGDTKSGKPRVVDLDPATVTALTAGKVRGAAWRCSSPGDDALVFADHGGAATCSRSHFSPLVADCAPAASPSARRRCAARRSGCTICGTRTRRSCKGAELHRMHHSVCGVRQGP